MSILITGGSGFLGSYLKQKYEYDQIEHLAPSSQELNINNIENISEFFSNHTIDAVIHLAAEADHISQQTFQTNILGTYNIAKVARDHHIGKFVFASTNNVYGLDGLNYREEDYPIPGNQYGVSKLIGEYIIREHFPTQHSILRFSDLYGAGQKYGNLFKVFLENSRSLRPLQIYGDGKRVRDYLYIQDAVNAIMHVVTQNVTGTFNVSSGVGTSTIELAKIICAVYGNEQPIQHVPISNEDKSIVVLNNEKFLKTGFSLTYSLEAGIKEIKRRFNDEEKN